VRKNLKEIFEVLNLRLLGCGTVSNGKGDLPQENIAYNFRV
jgi:hypothetical protein